ncbi:MAG: hypothetical protein L6262_06585 [Weeksellaceae bacterium]|nr:hypothetical protein [Weeksellaceae bacterium]
MGFLTLKQKLFIVAPILLLMIISIILSKTDKDYYKKQYYNQYGQGKVVSNTYNSSCHCNTVKLSDYNTLNLDELKIIILIKKGDSLVKQKNTTYFTVYKRDNSRIIYDMYNKNLKVIK